MWPPWGIALTGDALTTWIADDRISIWSRPNTGSIAWSPQTTLGSLGAGTSNFDYPSGVAMFVDEHTMAIADSSNDQISIWRADRSV